MKQIRVFDKDCSNGNDCGFLIGIYIRSKIFMMTQQMSICMKITSDSTLHQSKIYFITLLNETPGLMLLLALIY